MRLFLTLLIVTVLASCATNRQSTFNIEVDSLASKNAEKYKTYLLIPGNDDITWQDLQFQEYAIYLMRALNLSGYISAESPESADIAIVLSYGIGDPQTSQYSYSLPTWGQTGISSSNTYGSATTFGNYTSFNASTTYTPEYGVSGYNTYSGSRTSFFRFALITGYDYEVFKETEENVQLWQTTVTSVGSSGDLRRVFPILIGASIPYLGTSTLQKVQIKLRESDNAVKAVKGLPSN